MPSFSILQVLLTLLVNFLGYLPDGTLSNRCWSNFNAGRHIGPFRPCYENRCRCTNDIVDCSNSGQLSYLPQISDTVKQLNISNNNLSIIYSPLFFENTSRNLEVIDMYNNNLRAIPVGAFLVLHKLKRLLIGGNNLNYHLLSAMDIPELRSLEVKCSNLGNIPREFFKQCSYKKLRYLDMSWNKIKSLDLEVFLPLKVLRHLGLKKNSINELKSTFMSSLKSLSLVQNSLHDFPKTCDENGSSLFPNLTFLNLNFNDISVIPELVCLPSLSVLSLSFNKLNTFRQGMFSNERFPTLRELNLSKMKSGFWKMEAFAFNNSNLNKIQFGWNNVKFCFNNVHEDVFQGCQRLEMLYLDRTVFEHVSEEKFHRLFNNLRELKVLHLGKTSLKIFPKTFISLPALERVYLYENFIRSIPDGCFDHLVNLTVLKLGKNQITAVSSTVFSQDTKRRLKEIDLSGNPFTCSPEDLHMPEWMTSQPDIFVEFEQAGYYCANLQNKTLSGYYISQQQSKSRLPWWPIIIIILLVLTIICLRRYWQLKRKHTGRPYHQVARCEYDVFLSYETEADRDLVKENILPVLEDQMHLNVFDPERDIMPGVPEKIYTLKGLESSRHVIVVLSVAYAKDAFSEMVLRSSDTHTTECRSVILPILLPELQNQDMTDPIRDLLRSSKWVLKWPEREEDAIAFWKKLETALKETEDETVTVWRVIGRRCICISACVRE